MSIIRTIDLWTEQNENHIESNQKWKLYYN